MVSDNLRKIIAKNKNEENIYTPTFYRLAAEPAKKALEQLLSENPAISICDTMRSQLRELIKSRTPKRAFTDAQLNDALSTYLDGKDVNEYGVWIYYPWRQELVHTLDKEEFIELRTNRNKYKITQDEQDLLAAKTVGVIGLSVGHSIAMTLVNERVCAHIRLADFDTIDLSNLNRIRTGIQNVGINKAVVAAREIAEIDPYVTVELFTAGITDENINAFFTGGGKKLDLLVEVCDGLNIKIVSRFKAKQLGIPVVMDTNDRGMLDVERFDLEPDRPIMHGLAGDLDPQKIKSLTNEEKIPYILTMIGAETISPRLKASMMEVEQTISTWPQLASSVTLGGALVADVCRRIFLDQYHDSGRYYIDLEAIIADKHVVHVEKIKPVNPFKPLEKKDTEQDVAKYFQKEPQGTYALSDHEFSQIQDAAAAAPSAGNNQPWKWTYRNGVLFLFHDQYRSWSWGDFQAMGSFISLGSALENIHLQSVLLHLDARIHLFPLGKDSKMVAAVRFAQSSTDAEEMTLTLARNLYNRHTNRKLTTRKKLPVKFYEDMRKVIAGDSVKMFYTDDDNKLEKLSRIIAECDKVRLLNEQGHEEFYSEIRWTDDDAAKDHDGIQIASVDLTNSEIAGFRMARDWEAVKLISEWDKGDAFMKLSTKAIQGASSIVIFAVPTFGQEQFIEAGRAVLKAWIYANAHDVSVHPMLSSAFFFSRLIHGNGAEMSERTIENLKELRKDFVELFKEELNEMQGYSEIFVMKLGIADEELLKTIRKPKDEIFY